MKINIFCVTFNSYDSLYKYLDSIEVSFEKNETPIELKVFVADNSTEKIPIIKKYSFEVIQINLNNLGYFGGAFEIINNCDDVFSADYSVISNVDLRIDCNFFKELQKVIISQEVGWIAPCIYSSLEKRDKNPQRISRCSRQRLILLKVMFSFPLLQNIYAKTFYKRKRNGKSYSSGSTIYSGHGSFIILTKAFFKNYFKIQYPCFLYGEEIFLGEIIRKKNLTVNYYPELKIYDEEHVSTSLLANKEYCQYNKEAIVYLLKTFFKRGL